MFSNRHSLKLIIGLAIGAVFFYLTVRSVNFGQVLAALTQTNYWLVALSAGVMMTAHGLRAMRWRFLLAPVKLLHTRSLFSALLIGYAPTPSCRPIWVSSCGPSSLGKSITSPPAPPSPPSWSSASWTWSRLSPSWRCWSSCILFRHGWKTSGYIMLAGALLLCAVLIGCKRFEAQTVALIRTLARPLPERIGQRFESLTLNFLHGVVPLKSAAHYLATVVLSIAIWLCYAAVYYICLAAFNFVAAYHLAWYVGLVVLVFTTISVVIPSTPGYVGTFHYLCQVSLVMFGVSASAALSFAVIAHIVAWCRSP